MKQRRHTRSVNSYGADGGFGVNWTAIGRSRFTVEEALARSGELTVKEIEVCKTGRFWTVTARRCYRLLGPPVTYWEHGPPRPMW
jgi:hypothetical protein